MACPFFLPGEPIDGDAWLTPPRLPLGDPCRGTCHAEPDRPVEPPIGDLRSHCNVGYARGQCGRFPAGAEADAVRFSVALHGDDTVQIIYVFEKDYGPLGFGPASYDARERRFAGLPANPILEAQAERFIDSYLRRRTKS